MRLKAYDVKQSQTITSTLNKLRHRRLTDLHRKVAKGPKGLRVMRPPVKVSYAYDVIKFNTIKKEKEEGKKKYINNQVAD